MPSICTLSNRLTLQGPALRGEVSTERKTQQNAFEDKKTAVASPDGPNGQKRFRIEL